MRSVVIRLVALSALTLLLFALAVPVGASKGNPDVDLPFRGTFWGDEVSFNLVVPPGRCVEMAAVADSVTTFKGEGIATHMGRVTVEAQHCSDLDTGQYGDGMLTITAANGDVLKATYTNGVSLSGPPIIPFTDVVTFIGGGTGRFTHASGGALESGVFYFLTNEWTVHTEGTIRYSK